MEVKKHVEKPVFAPWVGDTVEVTNACVTHDKNNWSILPKVAESIKEQLRVE